MVAGVVVDLRRLKSFFLVGPTAGGYPVMGGYTVKHVSRNLWQIQAPLISLQKDDEKGIDKEKDQNNGGFFVELEGATLQVGKLQNSGIGRIALRDCDAKQHAQLANSKVILRLTGSAFNVVQRRMQVLIDFIIYICSDPYAIKTDL